MRHCLSKGSALSELASVIFVEMGLVKTRGGVRALQDEGGDLGGMEQEG